VVDLSSSSDEEGLIIGTSCDEKFTRRLFGDLNRNILGLPSDDKIIILSESDKEEEEEREEKTVGAEAAPSSAARSPTSTSSTNLDDAPRGRKMIIVMITPPIGRLTVAAMAETKPVCLGLLCQDGAVGGVLQGEHQGFCTTTPPPLLCRGVGMVM
jgi:hypothetical protein